VARGVKFVLPISHERVAGSFKNWFVIPRRPGRMFSPRAGSPARSRH
jgi:hypothetical protein